MQQFIVLNQHEPIELAGIRDKDILRQLFFFCLK